MKPHLPAPSGLPENHVGYSRAYSTLRLRVAREVASVVVASRCPTVSEVLGGVRGQCRASQASLPNSPRHR